MRSEGIRPVSLDSSTQFRLLDGFDDDIDIHSELLVEQRLNPPKIDEVEPRSDRRGNDHVDIAHSGFVAARNRSKNRGMRDSSRLKGRLQLPKDCESLIAFHDTKIRYTCIKFTWKRKGVLL